MLEDKIVIVPQNLYFEDTIKFIKNFSHFRENKNYIFDFGSTKKIDPFSLLFLSNELIFFKKQNPDSKFFAKNYDHFSYAAHMGFFKAFGLDFGKNPGEANGSKTYYPLTIFDTNEIRKKAGELLVNPGEYLEEKAEKISDILTQKKDPVVTEVLKYSIREILRNIIEHSNSIKFSFCAQYLPSLGKVTFAVLDSGVGLKNTLQNNPKINVKNDLEAINWSLKPGVSGKTYPGQKNKPTGEWANSGFGLYMTSNICKRGGSFFIASGKKGVFLSDKQTKEFDLNSHGTIVVMTINLNKIDTLSKMLSDLRSNLPKNIFQMPSKSSMNLK